MNDLDSNTDDDVNRSPLVWHPLIGAILWLVSWAAFSIFAVIVWEFLAIGELHFGSIFVRTCWLFLALLMLTVVLFFVELFASTALWARDKYEQEPASLSILVVLMVTLACITLAIVVPYLWLVKWILGIAWDFLAALDMSSKNSDDVHQLTPSWYLSVALAAISIVLGRYIYSMYKRKFFSPYRDAYKLMGLRGVLGRILLMSYLRFLVPRRDFFLQAPVISWVPGLAICILIHAYIPITIFAWIIPLMVLWIFVSMQISYLAPPLWLYLGSSHFDSFRVFTKLRWNWRRYGLTLLDRAGSQGTAYYYAERKARKLTSFAPADPSASRVWSLRTRPAVWSIAVRLLIRFTPVIVVDITRQNDIVQDEIEWLVTHGHASKAFFLVLDDSRGSNLNDRLECQSESQSDAVPASRLFVEETLVAAEWDNSGIHLPTLESVGEGGEKQ